MNILYVNCCISPNEKPRTARLASAFMTAYCNAHPDSLVEEVDLTRSALQSLNTGSLRYRETLADNGKLDDDAFSLARQFAAADRIVIAAPYWELSFPSILKVYVENVAVTNLTFGYTEDGAPRGLCRAERMLYLTCSGGALGTRNLGADYMHAMCDVFGIPDFNCIAAEMQDVQGADNEGYLQDAIARAEEFAQNF